MTRALGRTGADVTILGYGAMELRGQPRGPEIADEDAGRLLNAVLDGGINLIDTSPDYGRSEELIGTYIGHRRDEFFLASKCGCPIELPADAPPPYPHDYSAGERPRRRRAVLRRLRTDRLDLVQVHMSPSQATLEENGTVETLKDLQAEGKVRFIGMSGILPNLADHIAMGVFDVFQIPYSARPARPREAHHRGRGRRARARFIRGGAARGAASRGQELAGRPADPGARRRPAQLGDLRHRRPAGRGGHEPAWSSCCASRSATPACRPRSSARPARPTWPPTSPSRRGARSRPTSTRRPPSASPSLR